MSREPGDDTGDAVPDRAGPSGTPDDAFDRIVAGWRDEGSVPTWPDAPETAPSSPVPADDGPAPSTPPPSAPPASAQPPVAPSSSTPPPIAPPPPPSAVHRPGPEQLVDDDHFHPPEPPPLPRPGPPALVGAVLIGIGLLLVAVPETLGLSSLYGLPLGLVGIAAGLTWLVMRMWPSEDADDDHYDDPDDGAVL